MKVTVLTIIYRGVLEDVHAATSNEKARDILVSYLTGEHGYTDDMEQDAFVEQLNDMDYDIQISEIEVI